MLYRTPASALLFAALLIGCASDSQTDPGPTGLNRVPVRALSDDANRLLSQAVAGVRRRGEQDEMLQLEAQLPGFGGFFLDSLSEVVVYLKPIGQPESAPSATSVRALIASRYASRTTPVRELMAPATRAQIRVGQYSLSELIAIENRISSSPVRIDGFSGVGTSLFLNRVKVGFRGASDLSNGLAVIASLGVPRDAIIPEVWGETRLAGTWSSVYRPSRGGLQTGTANILRPAWFSEGSHGFNVRSAAGTNYMLMSAHQTNLLIGTNGTTGDTVYQPLSFLHPLAQVAVNPPWTQGAACGMNPATGQLYNYCTSADVALATFLPGQNGERKIGTSQYEGSNGQVGSQQINNWYPVAGTVPPEFIQAYHNIVHKSGQATGTTTGFIDLPCSNVGVQSAWGPSGQVWLLQTCVTRVSFAGWGARDSGAPVFARKLPGGSYFALGIMTTGQGTQNSVGTCIAGQLCAYFFAKWSSIESQLGVGTLNPAT